MRSERQGCAVEQSLAGRISQGFKHAVEFGYIQLADVFFGKQGGQVTQKTGGNSMRRCDAPAFLFLEGNEPRLPRQHLNSDAQDARQQLLKVKFLGERARYF